MTKLSLRHLLEQHMPSSQWVKINPAAVRRYPHQHTLIQVVQAFIKNDIPVTPLTLQILTEVKSRAQLKAKALAVLSGETGVEEALICRSLGEGNAPRPSPQAVRRYSLFQTVQSQVDNINKDEEPLTEMAEDLMPSGTLSPELKVALQMHPYPILIKAAAHKLAQNGALNRQALSAILEIKAGKDSPPSPVIFDQTVRELIKAHRSPALLCDGEDLTGGGLISLPEEPALEPIAAKL